MSKSDTRKRHRTTSGDSDSDSDSDSPSSKSNKDNIFREYFNYFIIIKKYLLMVMMKIIVEMQMIELG